MNTITVQLPAARLWLRVARPEWTAPLDPTYAQRAGGRWNPPKSFPTLYLNADVLTAQLQIERLLRDTPVYPEDLSDDAYRLVLARLPDTRPAADAVSDDGLRAIGLPETYPVDHTGQLIDQSACQTIGASITTQSLSAMWCRSACSADGQGRELAWFCGAKRARSVGQALPYGRWRFANGWADLKVPEQVDPQ